MPVLVAGGRSRLLQSGTQLWAQTPASESSPATTTRIHGYVDPSVIPVASFSQSVVTDFGGNHFRIEKSSGSGAWDGSAASSHAFTGDFSIGAQRFNAINSFFVGVATDATVDAGFAWIDYSIVWESTSATWQAWAGSTYLGHSASDSGGTLLAWIWRTGSTIGWGVGADLAAAQASPFHTVGSVSGPLYFDTSIYDAGTSFDVYLTEGSAAPGAITAAASVTLGSFLSAAAAKALVHGTGSGTLNAFASSSAAKVRVKGAASTSPSAFTVASAGKVRVKGSAAITPNAFATASVGKARVKASASPALSAYLSAAAAKALIEGVGSGVLSAFASSSAGRVRVKATAAPAFASWTISATGAARLAASASPHLSPFVSAASVQALIEGAGSGTLSLFGSTSAANVKIGAIASPSLGSFTIAGRIAIPAIQAAAAITLSPFVSSGAAKAFVEGIGGGTLNPFTMVGRLTARVSLAGSILVGDFTSVGSIRRPVPVPPARVINPAVDVRTTAPSAMVSRSVAGAAPLARSVQGRRAVRSVSPDLQPRRASG